MSDKPVPPPAPPSASQTYVPPTVVQRPLEPAPGDVPKVQISEALRAPPARSFTPHGTPAATGDAPRVISDAAHVQAPRGQEAAPTSTRSFGAQPMGAQPAAATPFAPQVMGPQPAAATPFAPQVMGPQPAAPFAPQVMGPQPAAPFAPQVMGPQPAAPFAPQVMGPQPAAATPFAPQVMGSQPAAATPFAPQVMGPQPAAATPFAPQVMGPQPAAATPFAPQVMGPQAPPAPAPAPAAPAPQAMPSPPPAPPAPPPEASSAEDDHGLAASPWNTGSMSGLNRDLLPSAMVAGPPRSEPEAQVAAKPVPAVETPSRTPWIIVGVLVVVAIIGGGVTIQMARRSRGSGQIAIPVTAGTVEDTPTETVTTSSAPSATAPVVRHAPRPKTYLEDPYADPTPTPRSKAPAPAPAPPPTQPTALPRRLFGTDD